MQYKACVKYLRTTFTSGYHELCTGWCRLHLGGRFRRSHFPDVLLLSKLAVEGHADLGPLRGSLIKYLAELEGRGVEVDRHQLVRVRTVLYPMNTELIAHIDGGSLANLPGSCFYQGPVRLDTLLGPVISYFLDPAAEDPHEAVGVAVVVNRGHGTLRPAHQNEVKIPISLMHEVPCVLVFVPLGELGPVLPIALVPVEELNNVIDIDFIFILLEKLQQSLYELLERDGILAIHPK